MKKHKLILFLGCSGILLFILLAIVMKGRDNEDKPIDKKTEADTTTEAETIVLDSFLVSDAITERLLTINEYSRPGTPLKKVNGIVIHYVGNPSTTAENNRNYFENLKDTHERSASSHYIVGLEGEILQCVPLDEVSYASNNRNNDTIAIECCHPDATGKFNSKTYDSLVKLTAALCKTYNLNPTTDILRHYDITGKMCPLYYVENEDEWRYFITQVVSQMK